MHFFASHAGKEFRKLFIVFESLCRVGVEIARRVFHALKPFDEVFHFLILLILILLIKTARVNPIRRFSGRTMNQ